MSLHPQPITPVPEDTVRVARAAFPKGNMYMKMRDELGTIYQDQQFASLFPTRGQPAEVPWRLALVCVFQFIEGLSDRQAADAVRSRIDWKYALGLELTDPGFDFSVLSEFRARLISGELEEVLLNTMLDNAHSVQTTRLAQRARITAHRLDACTGCCACAQPVGDDRRNPQGSTKCPGRCCSQLATRTGGSRVVRPVRPTGRGIPTAKRPRTTIQVCSHHWWGGRFSSVERSLFSPASSLAAGNSGSASAALRRVWMQQYIVIEGQIQLRSAQDLPPAGARIDSPYDPEASYGNKRSATWTGYKVHITETCGRDPDEVHLITNVETTQAHITDVDLTAPIHKRLATKELLPDEHLLDAGYLAMLMPSCW